MPTGVRLSTHSTPVPDATHTHKHDPTRADH